MSAHADMREMLARRAELSSVQEMQLRDHLRSCPECRRAADAYALQTALLRSLPSVDPPADIRTRVLQNIHHSQPAARRWPSFRPAFLAAPLAAALLILVAALAYVNRPHSAAHTASGVYGVQQHPTAALIQVPKPQKEAGLKNTAAPRHAPLPPAHSARRSSSPHRAPAPTPMPYNPPNGTTPSSPQEPQQPVVSQQLPPTAADIPARAPVATLPAVAAVAAQPTTRRATRQRPTYAPVASAAGGAPASTTKPQAYATPTPAPLPPGIAVPGTPPAFGAAPVRPTATPAPAAPPTAPPSTPAATPIPVGVAASAPTPPAARAAPPAEPPASSPTPLVTPTP